jgi:hypothetical protein
MGPLTHGCLSKPGNGLIQPLEKDIDLMKLALEIASITKDGPTDALAKAPPRPAYARNLPTRGQLGDI